MKRTMDVSRLNAVANHPEVYPQLGVTGAVDLSGIASNPANVVIENEHGGFVFWCLEPGRYEMHTMFLPEGRGRAALDAAAEALRYMFVETPAVEVVTKTAGSNPAAGLMARKAGFSVAFEREGVWIDKTGLTYFSMTLDQWIARDPVAPQEGAAFHAMLEGAKRSCGSELPIHPDDQAHDRVAGTASLMARAGNARKAVAVYSRWARFAGYAPIELVSETPPIIDVRDAVIGVRGGQLEVLLCR